MKRRLTPEIMDDPNTPEPDLDHALRYIKSINRRMGGVSALTEELERRIPDWPKDTPMTMLDIATGAADLPIAAREWALRRGVDLRITGIDLHPTTLALARRDLAQTTPEIQQGITLLELDAFASADHFGNGSFDLVHAGLFLHHLPDARVPTLLAAMRRVARHGVIWNDLVRSRVGYAAIHLMTLGQPRIVRHDACQSVHAGFTRREALAHAQAAGWAKPEYRWSLFTHRFTVSETITNERCGASA